METPPAPKGPSRLPVVALIVVILVLAGGFGYYYVQATGTISSLNQSVTSQAGVISAKVQVIAGLNSTIASLNTQVATLNAKVSADLAKIQTLNATIATDSAQIATLQGQVTQDETQIAALNGQVSTLNSQIADLQSVISLQVKSTLVSSQVYQVAALGCTDVINVPNSDAGYLVVTFSTSTSNVLIGASDQGGCTSPFADNPTVYVFPSGTSGTYSIPMAPTGSGTHVFIANGQSTAITVTLTVIEYT